MGQLKRVSPIRIVYVVENGHTDPTSTNVENALKLVRALDGKGKKVWISQRRGQLVVSKGGPARSCDWTSTHKRALWAAVDRFMSITVTGGPR